MRHLLTPPKHEWKRTLLHPFRENEFSAMLFFRKIYHEDTDGSSQFSLELLMGAFGAARCSEARYRVYALLGIADTQELVDYPVYPDYTKPTADLFAELCSRYEVRVGRIVTTETRTDLYFFAACLKMRLEMSDDNEVYRPLVRRIEVMYGSLGGSLFQERTHLAAEI
jgi:hypothetical protein